MAAPPNNGLNLTRISLRSTRAAWAWYVGRTRTRARQLPSAMTPASIDLTALESRLALSAPPGYREYIRSNAIASVVKQGFDPKTLLILNLELNELEHFEGISKRFFLNGDGCGNYHFVDLTGDQNEVLLWAHDPPGIEHPGQSLANHLRDSEQDCRIDWPIDPGHLWICRTSAYAESILDPISLDEWIEAVRSTEGLEYRGYREGKNPFSGESFRVETPGLSAVVGHKKSLISFLHGRARLDNLSLTRLIATPLASTLKANLLGSTSVE